MQLESITAVGTRWIHHVGDLLPAANWHEAIPRPEKKRKWADFDDDVDSTSHALLHEVIEDLELDDRHAEFLEAGKEADAQEEDEVEKMLGKVEECCEGLKVHASTSDDVSGLFVEDNS